MEIRPVGMWPLTRAESTSDAARASTNAGSSSDSIASAAPKESWGSCASRWLCFVPNLIWSVLRKIVNIVTCNNFCVDKPSQKEVRENLEAVLKVWQDKEAKPEDKKEAFEGMSDRVREEAVEKYVAQKRVAELGLKASDEQIANWNTERAETVREAVVARLADQDISLMDSMIALAADDNA